MKLPDVTERPASQFPRNRPQHGGKSESHRSFTVGGESIAATVINHGLPRTNSRSSVTERGMLNEKEHRQLPIAVITVGLMLFFGTVSLSISHVALHTGLLADSAPAQTTLAA
jgi:hypothetical protein